ncbi:hypothetical protein SERLA73DRAFT_105076 [Serpula lacrymans var. lacrymans S7.3]|uniref:RNA helicase n=1 Tax=Serpula lacrymans var. lacrymans (strain S7.3) TaxID=936435 RepID=F8PS91_SERL3|nr:hypothetical protein SERLA73DRAFT_105076 [Serpula lacrymans var. lacrymans S7.3]
MSGDFIMTIDSDEEHDSPAPAPRPVKGRNTAKAEDAQLNPDFDFLVPSYNDASEIVQNLVEKVSKANQISIDEIIARRKLKTFASKRKRVSGGNKSDITDSESGSGEGSDAKGSEESDEEEEEEEEDPLATSSEEDNDEENNSEVEEDGEGDSSDDSNSTDENDEGENLRKAAYFDDETRPSETHASFLTMNLSRPIIKALTTMGLHKPTPIQAAAVPVALLGKDVVGGAVTGSGKTAAFTIPIIERLLYRDKGKNAAATRCLVVVPTRELAVQCFEVGTRMAGHTDVRFCLVVGGLSLKSQEAALRSRPDVLIATPGRLIDHLHNSPSFTLDALDILVLDEADRMLEDGFADELTEIVKACPVSRQTMLFSATMTDSVDKLIRLSLTKPVRIFVDAKRSMAKGLVQEFVRVRPEKEKERPALLLCICKRTFKTRVIVFFRSKKLAHQMRIVFGLLDMKCDELHGDLSQEQRLKALQAFRDGSVDYLMATDLASRGLDIKGIETVINFDMPSQLAQYLHRVGRTARAGKTGRSVTFVGEADRKMLRAVVKHSAGEDSVRHRVVPADVVSKWAQKFEQVKEEVSVILKEEKEEKQLRQAEMELKKGQNMIEHEKEIYSRPARTWFQTGQEKNKAAGRTPGRHKANSGGKQKPKDAAQPPKRDKYAGLSRKAKRRKMAMEEDS